MLYSGLKMMLMWLFQKSMQAWLLVEGMCLYLDVIYSLCSVPMCLILLNLLEVGFYNALCQLLKSRGRSTSKNYELDQRVF